MARSITIYYGSAIIPFDDFMKAIIFTDDIALTLDVDTTNFARLYQISLSRQAFQGGVSQNLLSLLLRYRLALTTDPKDKVFALCGLAGDAGPEGLDIPIDYCLPVEEVYRDVAVRMLTRLKNLDILSIPRIDKSSPLPSWIPDLSRPVEVVSLTGAEHNVWNPSPYHASRQSECSPEFAQDRRLPGLSGFIFDVITKTSETRIEETGDADAFAFTYRLHKAFVQTQT